LVVGGADFDGDLNIGAEQAGEVLDDLLCDLAEVAAVALGVASGPSLR